MHIRFCVAVAASLFFAGAQADEPSKRLIPVPGEKLDSGIAEVARAASRAAPAPARDKPARTNIIVGEKLDSGLGDAVARR